MNSHLVEIETAEEDNFIRTTLQSFQVTRKWKHVHFFLLIFHLLVHSMCFLSLISHFCSCSVYYSPGTQFVDISM